MKQLVLVAIAFLSVHCFLDETEPMLANQHASTILTGQDALDPILPKTPRQGHFQTIELQPPTTMNPAFSEAIQQELIGLQTVLGVAPIPDNRQLAKLFEKGSAPPPATMSMVVGVDPLDIIAQETSWYQRAGTVMHTGFNVLWQNGKNTAGIPAATTLELELPFTPNSDAIGSSIHLLNSNFRADNVNGDQYMFGPGVPTKVDVRRVTGPALSFVITVGSDVVDANLDRIVRGIFTYRIPSTPTRNPEWPFIIWISFPDVHEPLPSAKITFEYDSAKLGDVIDLLDSGLSVVQSLPALGAPDVPDGKNSFTVIAADTYHVRLRGVISEGYVVD